MKVIWKTAGRTDLLITDQPHNILQVFRAYIFWKKNTVTFHFSYILNGEKENCEQVDIVLINHQILRADIETYHTTINQKNSYFELGTDRVNIQFFILYIANPSVGEKMVSM